VLAAQWEEGREYARNRTIGSLGRHTVDSRQRWWLISGLQIELTMCGLLASVETDRAPARANTRIGAWRSANKAMLREYVSLWFSDVPVEIVLWLWSLKAVDDLAADITISIWQ
jgi:hypothetical protein